MLRRQNLGTFTKWTQTQMYWCRIKKVSTESCSFDLIFLSKNHFQNDCGDIWARKLTSTRLKNLSVLQDDEKTDIIQ